jgi:hypothetical protein
MQTFAVLIFGTIVGIVLGYAIGNSYGQREMLKQADAGLNDIQASLGLNKILEDRRWKNMLNQGCLDQPANDIDFDENQSMDLLAGHLKKSVSERTLKYINDRDPSLIRELKDFKSKDSGVFAEDSCTKK